MTNHKATKNTPIRENEIRSALLRLMSTISMNSSIVREEFRIERGSARIDVAEIGAKLVGYEIKSDLDTFSRFSNQIHAYNRVFDEIHLVCGQIHANLAIEIVPSWWGITLADRNHDDAVTLTPIRPAGRNPYQDPFSLASLLWRDEALAILLSEDKKVPNKASSYTLWDCMVKTLSLDKIKVAVTETLINREYYNECIVKAI